MVNTDKPTETGEVLPHIKDAWEINTLIEDKAHMYSIDDSSQSKLSSVQSEYADWLPKTPQKPKVEECCQPVLKFDDTSEVIVISSNNDSGYAVKREVIVLDGDDDNVVSSCPSS